MKVEGKDWIQTYTGHKFYPLNASPADVRINDVAHALSMICRYTGHVRRFYSVAEHSVRVSILAEQLAREKLGTQSPETVNMIARWGLLHDATEAYLADIAAPVKHTPTFDKYREAERALELVICEAAGLPPDMPSEVKRADAIMLVTEARELLVGGPLDNWTAKYAAPLPEVQGFGWDPSSAEGQFLARFRALGEVERVNS